MSKQATCGVDGKAFIAARIPARLCGSCSGASGMSPLQRRDHKFVDQLRLDEVQAAVHDAVADCGDGESL